MPKDHEVFFRGADRLFRPPTIKEKQALKGAKLFRNISVAVYQKEYSKDSHKISYKLLVKKTFDVDRN